MAKFWILTCLLFAATPLAVLCACAPLAGGSADRAPAGITEVDYSVGPCHGFCPAYAITLKVSGHSEFRGRRYTKEPGTREFPMDAELFKSIANLVVAARASAGTARVSQETCKLYATDQQEIEVRWSTPSEGSQSFELDLGCHDPQYEKSRSLISKARSLMPIDALVGRRTSF